MRTTCCGWCYRPCTGRVGWGWGSPGTASWSHGGLERHMVGWIDKTGVSCSRLDLSGCRTSQFWQWNGRCKGCPPLLVKSNNSTSYLTSWHFFLIKRSHDVPSSKGPLGHVDDLWHLLLGVDNHETSGLIVGWMA